MTFQEEIEELRGLVDNFERLSDNLSKDITKNYLLVTELKDTVTRANFLLKSIRKIISDENTKKRDV